MGGHHLKKFLLLPEVELFPVELNKERREELQLPRSNSHDPGEASSS